MGKRTRGPNVNIIEYKHNPPTVTELNADPKSWWKHRINQRTNMLDGHHGAAAAASTVKKINARDDYKFSYDHDPPGSADGDYKDLYKELLDEDVSRMTAHRVYENDSGHIKFSNHDLAAAMKAGRDPSDDAVARLAQQYFFDGK